MGEKRGMQALEAWCRQVTAGYNGVNVTNMTSSWKDGMAFCALVHHFRPDLIDFDSLSAENVYHNNQLAFSVAENVLGIPALLDAEDMVNYVPDRLSIMTYLSQFYQVLASPKSKGGSSLAVGLKRPAERTAPAAVGCDGPDSSSAPTGTTTTPVKEASLEMRGQQYKAEIFARQLEQDGGRPQSRRVSDLCVSCQHSVFLAERLMVNGRLHHRVCFRCARCQSQLSLANYYETEQGQYCCETCPDEVVAARTTNPTEPITESSSPSANLAASEPISNKNDDVPQELERPSSAQQRRFLDSMVEAEAAQVSETIANVPLHFSQNEIDPCQVPQQVKEEEEEEKHLSIVSDDVVEVVEEPEEAAAPVQKNEELESVSTDATSKVEEVESAAVAHTVDEELESDAAQPPVDELEDDKAAPSHTVQKENEELESVSIDVVEEVEATAEKEDEKLESDATPVDSLEDKVVSSPASPVIQVESVETPEEQVVVVPKPRRRKSKRSSTPQKTILDSSVAEYPEELNPFDDEPEGEPADGPTEKSCQMETPKKIIAAPKISLNPFGSDDEDEINSDPVKSSEKVRPGRPPPPILKSPTTNPSPSPKKRLAPAPPPPKPQRTAESLSSPETNTMSRRKSAPPPPMTAVPSPKPRVLLPVTCPPLSPLPSPSEKAHKDLSNLNLQCAVNKDSHGQWKRKKGPAPPRPSPQKRQLRKLPLKGIQQELDDIEVKQVELERQGVNLEQNIRSLTEPEDGSEATGDGIHIEEMILQLFDLVNEKNELLRRQTELMYLRRQQRLEEEHAELEYQIRCLMDKPNGEKTDEDRLREEELINRLVQVVHRRAEIVDCLEMDRRRQVEEDESIQQHLDVFNSRGAAAIDPLVSPPIAKTKSKSLKMIQSPIKLMKKEKLLKKSKKNSKVDADKEVDESETCKKSPSQSDAAEAGSSLSSPPLRKEKDKNKTKSWFAK